MSEEDGQERGMPVLGGGRWAVRGRPNFGAKCYPQPRSTSLPSEFAFLVHPPLREDAVLGEKVIFFFLYFSF